MTAVMLDIETLGRSRGCAIVSIGAVEFGPDGLGESFYRSVSLTSCEMVGLDVDAETVEWWLSQDDEARGEITGGIDLSNALAEFTTFYRGADEVWANAPAFDCEILEAAYEAVALAEPWSYDEERCHRTLRAFPQAADVEPVGDAHNALDDAVYQAEVAYRTLNRLEYWDT